MAIHGSHLVGLSFHPFQPQSNIIVTKSSVTYVQSMVESIDAASSSHVICRCYIYSDDTLSRKKLQFVGYGGIKPSLVDSIRLAMLTVSPNRQYLGMAIPTTPATQGPVCNPVIKK